MRHLVLDHCGKELPPRAFVAALAHDSHTTASGLASVPLGWVPVPFDLHFMLRKPGAVLSHIRDCQPSADLLSPPGTGLTCAASWSGYGGTLGTLADTGLGRGDVAWITTVLISTY
jgi:hypothetical protein